ncbi:unnamed protein product [Aphanomyces euteiches]|uniref:Uncharacterized protein n=1 Tax=Aphanomyces euteiches TaxID=100861 RepID=A0A6G0X5B0_9STRA|nr:hypothetical protein Ae201684_008332 [Aphanomyces euteiches]KAH9070622.1 hypothetical protein Ae201684P_002978 [Aphanomyces euteiches]KAH9157426.1 hypothetical protein AeRB84_000730 [Aphanomyces euteiches]
MDAAFASHALSDAECKRLASFGPLNMPPQELKKQFFIQSIEDSYGPGLLVLRKYAEQNEIVQAPRTNEGMQAKESLSWFASWMTNCEENANQDMEVQEDIEHVDNDVVDEDAFRTPLKPRHGEIDSVQVNVTATTVTKTTSAHKRSHTTITETVEHREIHAESFHSPVATQPGHVYTLSSVELTSPAPVSSDGSSRLWVQLPENTSNEITPSAKQAAHAPPVGISPVIAASKKKIAAQPKKRHFEDVAPEKPAPISEENTSEDEDEVDIVLRHDATPISGPQRRRWSMPSFFNSNTKSPTKVAQSPSSLEELLNLPPDTSSIWERLKAIRMPDILAEGLHFSDDASNQEDDAPNIDDDLCCGFDLMNVDDMNDPHPLTIDFSLTPMTECDHSLPHPESTKSAGPNRPRTRSQRKRRLTRGISLSNLTRCQNTNCDDLQHEWGRFSTCGRLHGRWCPN